MAEGYIDLSQEQYLSQFCAEMGLDVNTTIPAQCPQGGAQLSKDDPMTDEEKSKVDSYPLRRVLGKLMFNMVCCNPTISHALKRLARFVTDPRPSHIAEAKHLLRYVAGTAHEAHRLRGGADAKVVLSYVCDSNDSNDPDHRRSINGCLEFFGQYFEVRNGIKTLGNPSFFGWYSEYTIWVPESSCVSEMYGIAGTLRKAKYTRPFLGEISSIPFLAGVRQTEPTTIMSDCSSAILIARGQHPGRFKGTKHLERRVFAIQISNAIRQTQMELIASDLNVCDLLVTWKNANNYLKLRKVLSGHEYSPRRPARGARQEGGNK